MNRQAQVQFPFGPVATLQYDKDGRKTSVRTDSSVKQYLYDAVGRNTSHVEADALGNPVATTVDTYDAGGRKTASAKNGLLRTYSNGAINPQVGTAGDGVWETFVYGPVGNVLVKWLQGDWPRTSTYDAADRLVTEGYGKIQIDFTYDNAGNMTGQNENGLLTGWLYDGENRMTKRTNPDLTVMTNTYQGDGLRRSHHESSPNPVTYLWTGSDYLGGMN